MQGCIQCGAVVRESTYRYCSNKCQRDYQYGLYIKNWKAGRATGNRGVNAKNISRHLIRYLLEKYSGKCEICNWSEVNPITGRVPLEVDHIDGNSENNSESNLRLLCPNCHSLTPSYKNLNSGRGRSWRRLKYLKSI